MTNQFNDLIVLLVIVGVIVFILFNTLITVSQQTVGVIERLGKFVRVARAGLNIKIPFIETISGRMSLRVLQLDVPVETKTKDNVFVKVAVSVQYHVKNEAIYDAFYKLTNPNTQITSFVFDVVRAQVPKMDLDDVFEKKDTIAQAVKEELAELMSNFGYDIVKALVTDIDPDAKVKAAMNEINEQRRLRMAAEQKGEAEKIIIVKRAEADAASLRLSGQGIADQRRAIIEGLRESVGQFQQSVPGTSPLDVMNLVLVTQYYDTLKEIGGNNKATTLLLPSVPEGNNTFASTLRDSMLTAQIAADQNK
jgi:regulator of protease activity HflC (stomatin/prohibitin superfamily)